jgi:hypothetical protein
MQNVNDPSRTAYWLLLSPSHITRWHRHLDQVTLDELTPSSFADLGIESPLS